MWSNQPSTVMPALVPGIHVFFGEFQQPDVDGRDIRAFTPVFDGLLPGHDSGEVVQRNRDPL
jgi:hypothetical protein